MVQEIFHANDETQLVNTLQKIVKTNKWEGFNTGNKVKAANMTFDKESKNHAKYGWTNAHSLLEYKGDQFDVKSSKFLGTLLIRYLRPITEKLYNDGFLQFQGGKKSLKQEKEMYTRLNKLNFPTLTLRQDIVPENEKGIEKKVLITELVESPYHLIDAINESKSIEGKQKHIQNGAQALGHLHSLDEISGDPAVQNFMYDGNELLLFDFETKASPKFGLAQRKANDFIQYALNAYGHSGLSSHEVAQAVLKGYQPTVTEKNNLLSEYAVSKFPKDSLFRESLYSIPIHKLSVEKEQEMYNAILDFL